MLIGTASCGSTGYKTFSIKEGVQGFTFEYPEAYSIIRLDMSNTAASRYTTVGLGATINGAIGEIYIYIWPVSAGLNTASATLDTLLGNAQEVLTSFVLDTKATTTVNNQTAQGAAFTAVDTATATAASTGPAYYRVTCFVHDSWIVEIDMTCDISLKATTQDQYYRMLDTFALLG
jgi:hypothetical protein